jgi:glutathione peroxidase
MKTDSKDVASSPFDLSLELADGGTLDLHRLQGRPLLVVNTATRCGLAPQFESLEKLHTDYGPRGLTVLGVPSNQFANQEPETDEDMTAVCKRDHGVTFTLARKTLVNGPETHPVIALLKRMAPGFLGNQSIKWNFTKFLVWPDGKQVRRYSPTTRPDRIRRDIERLLA